MRLVPIVYSWLHRISLLDLLVIAAAALFITGLERDQISTKFPDPYYRHTASLAVALSELEHGTSGYTGLSSIFTQLQKSGLDARYLPSGITADESRALVNNAIAAALESPASAQADRMIIRENEVGMVDWFKICFLLFGYNVAAIAKLWYLFFGFLTVGFIVCFRGEVSFFRLVGFVSILAFAAFFETFRLIPQGSRYLPCLALYAVLLVVGLTSKAKHSIADIVFAVGASAIFALCFGARSIVAAQLGLAVAIGTLIVLFGPSLQSVNSLPRRIVRMWPVLLLVIFAGTAKVRIEAVKDPSYTQGTIVGHPVWLSLISVYVDAFDFMIPDLSASALTNAEDADAFAGSLLRARIFERGEQLKQYLREDESGWDEAKREALSKDVFFDLWRIYPRLLARFHLRRAFIDTPKAIFSLKLSIGYIALALLAFRQVATGPEVCWRPAPRFAGIFSLGLLFVAGNVLLLPFIRPTRCDLYVLGILCSVCLAWYLFSRHRASEKRQPI